MSNWYISCPFGIFPPLLLVCCNKKNQATLIRDQCYDLAKKLAFLTQNTASFCMKKCAQHWLSGKTQFFSPEN
jgi:hypothetical protein